MSQPTEPTIIQGGKSYTVAAYRAAFGALPPGVEARIKPAAAAPATRSSVDPNAPRLQAPSEAVEALRRMVAHPVSRSRSRELMQQEIAKGGADLEADGGCGRSAAGSGPVGSGGSMEAELRAQGLAPVRR